MYDCLHVKSTARRTMRRPGVTTASPTASTSSSEGGMTGMAAEGGHGVTTKTYGKPMEMIIKTYGNDLSDHQNL